MKRILGIILSVFLSSFISVEAHYTVHSSRGARIIESGKEKELTAGMKMNPTDMIIIPEGGILEIYNDVDKRIYSSTRSGKMSVTRLVIEAKGKAGSHKESINGSLRFGNRSSRNDARIYTEKGMVKRSMKVYDPEGDNVEMNATTLADFIAGRIRSGQLNDQVPPEVELISLSNDSVALLFKVRNNLEYPVYFNVIKIRNGNSPEVEISELGQPSGSYILLPGQSLSREHFPKMSSEYSHLMIMASCQYDIDEVLDKISEKLLEKEDSETCILNLPVELIRL